MPTSARRCALGPSATVPDDFADEVLARWEAEQEARADESSSAPASTR